MILRKNCYLGRSNTYHACCHPIFCLRTCFYPHFYLFNFSFMNIFSFAFEQGQTSVCFMNHSNYMFEMIFSLTLEESSFLCVSIRVSGNYVSNLPFPTFALVTLVTEDYIGRRAALVLLMPLIS